MEALSCIETRRSCRKFTQQPIPHETLKAIVKTASYAPSWKNTQVTRYTVVENPEVKANIAENGVLGFAFNTKTILRCSALAVQSVVHGVSGFEPDGSYSTSLEDRWETYDAGLSAEAFCLAAHNAGVGCVILGIIAPKKIAEILGLPENQKVTALIAMGYPEKVGGTAPPRLSVDELLTIV